MDVSDCGYDHEVRKSKLRRCPVNFARLAHVDVLLKNTPARLSGSVGTSNTQAYKEASQRESHQSYSTAPSSRMLSYNSSLGRIWLILRRRTRRCSRPARILINRMQSVNPRTGGLFERATTVVSIVNSTGCVESILQPLCTRIDDRLNPTLSVYNVTFVDAVFHNSP